MPDRVVTKAEFARLLEVSPARVSQYVAAGMPVRRDGRLYARRSLTNLLRISLTSGGRATMFGPWTHETFAASAGRRRRRCGGGPCS